MAGAVDDGTINIVVVIIIIIIITWITTHLPTREVGKAQLARLVDPQRTVYTQSGLLSAIDQAQRRESPQAKSGRPNLGATPPPAAWCHVRGSQKGIKE